MPAGVFSVLTMKQWVHTMIPIRTEEEMYRRTSMSGTKKVQITFPLRHFFPLKVLPLIEVLL
jgi:hypothetical protein